MYILLWEIRSKTLARSLGFVFGKRSEGVIEKPKRTSEIFAAIPGVWKLTRVREIAGKFARVGRYFY